MSKSVETSELVERVALELVHRHSLDEIEALLRSDGVDTGKIERLVLFIPSAFAAEHFAPQGIEFPQHFLAGPSGSYTQHLYEGEPIYAAARALAREWESQGRHSLVLRVLDWSAEANAIKQSRSEGLTLTRMSAVHHGIAG
jgi:hypothetical protein